MKEKVEETQFDEGKNFLIDLLKNKTALKLDVFQNTLDWFAIFKKELSHCLEALRAEINDPRIRLRIEERGDTSAELYVGSDVLVFTMHTNVFKLNNTEYATKTSYVLNEPKNAFCGIINIYNFLADSYEYNRSHDIGYLISRIFINQESHFLIEGKEQLGFTYRDFMHQVLTPTIIREIILAVSIHAINFDLYTPPYRAVQTASVNDLQTLNHSSKLKTGKRLGFKFESNHDVH